MMKALFSALVSFVAINSPAWSMDGGSTTAGDGGHAAECSWQSGTEQTRLLDVVDGEIRYGLSNDLNENNIEERLREAGLSSKSVTYFKERLQLLGESMVFRSNLPFVAPGGIFKREGFESCRIRQLGFRRLETNGVDLAVDPDFYSKLSAQEQFLFLVHERMHDFSPLGSSEFARSVVIYLGADKNFRQKNRKAFLRMMETGEPVEMKR